MKSALAKVVAILLVLMSTTERSLYAQTDVSWIGTTSGNWNTASNWNGGVVPNNGGDTTYDVTINPSTAGQTITLNLNATVTDLTLGSASGGNSVTLGSVANDSLTIAGSGTFTINPTGQVLFNTTGSNITIASGGTFTNSGSFSMEASGETLSVSGTTTNNSGATLNIEGGGMATFTGVTNSGTFQTGLLGGANTVNVSGTLTNNASGNFYIHGANDNVSVNALSNSGNLQIGTSAAIGQGTLTITGGGPGITDIVAGSTLTLFGNFNVVNGGTTTSALGSLNTVAGLLFLQNGQTTSITPSGGTLTIVANGQLQLSNSGPTNTTLNINGNVNVNDSGYLYTGWNGGINTVSVSGTMTNSGIIELFAGYNGHTGGTDLMTVNSLVNNGDIFTAQPGATFSVTSSTIVNNGSIGLQAGVLDFTASSVTITGTGSITIGPGNSANIAIQVGPSDTGTLTLASGGTINGAGNLGNGTLTLVNQGLIEANSYLFGGPLTVQPGSAGMTNTGTLEAAQGGILILDGTYNNAGGIIAALGQNGEPYAATVELSSGVVINGGTLETTTFHAYFGTLVGTIQATGAVTLNGVTNKGTGMFDVDAGTTTTLEGTNSNSGTINLSASTLSMSGDVTLNGKGTIVLSNSASNLITGATSGLTLTTANTIEGSGTISNLGITNTGTISADQSTALILLPNSAGLNNKGTLSVSSGDLMQIGTSSGGALLNYSSHRLTGGTYNVGGTLEFGASGTSITTDAANISLTSSAAEIENFAGVNLLTDLAAISSTGSFSLSGGANFTTASTLTVDGKLTVSNGSTLTVGNGGNDNQKAGTTTVDGGLTVTGAGVVNVTGGTILGAGTVTGNVSVGGSGTAPTISVGDNAQAGLLAITGNYTQLSTATMNGFIGGTTLGTQYSQLQVSGTATLAGTLTVTLASGFTPEVGSTFTVLTAAGIRGTFSNSTIAINSTEQFDVSYTSTGVVLTVVSIGAPQSGGSKHNNPVAASSHRPSDDLKHRVAGTNVAVRKASLAAISGISKPNRHSDEILARAYDWNSLAESNRVAEHIDAPWEHMYPVVAPVAPKVEITRAAPERVSQSRTSDSNWTYSAYGTSQRLPVSTLMRHEPIKILPQPTLPMLRSGK